MKVCSRPLLVPLAMTLAAAISFQPAIGAEQRAEQAAGEEEAGQDRSFEPWIEEVYVYARKRVEKFAEVPLSIDLYTSRDLQDAGVRDIDDLALFIPGFSFEKSFGRQLDRPVMRGMSTILSGTQIEQNVAFYIDGVFVSGAISSTMFQNLERIEVVRGPQNALYGRSAFSGAINYITRKPGDEFEGSVTASAASHDEYQLGLNLSGPLAPGKLSFYLGANHYEYGGEYLNTNTGDTLGGENTDAITAALYFTPTSSFDATLKVTWSNDQDEHHPAVLQDSTFNNCFLATFDQYYCGEVVEFSDVSLNTGSIGGGGLSREAWRAALTTNTRFGGYTLTTITAINDEDLEAGLDLDGTSREPVEAIPPLRGSFQTLDMTTFKDISQEVRITSPEGARWRWLAGGYFFHREHSGTNILPNTGAKPVTKTRNFAIFGQVQYDFSGQLTGTVDVRYGRDRKTLLLPDGTFLVETYQSFDPRFTIDYQPREGRLYFITIAKGSKPGGFNPRTQLPPELLSFEQETAWNYEAGAKLNFPNQGISLQGAVYYINWTNQQLTGLFQPPASRPIVFTQNAGQTRVTGAELVVRYRPSFAWEHVITYAYNDATFRVFEVAEQAALTGDPSVAGNRTPRAPRHMATFSTTFRHPVSTDTDFFIRGDILFESRRFAQVHNLAHTGNKVIVNVRVGIETENFTLALWVKNLTDDRTPVSIIRFRDFAGFDSFAAPRAFIITLPRGRQVGLTVSREF